MGKPWTVDDLEFFRATYPTAKTSNLPSLFPGRSKKALHQQAHKMGLYRGTSNNDVSGARTTILIPTDPTILAYAAGIIDGEGTITITMSAGSERKKYRKIQVAVINTHLGVIEWFRGNFGGQIYNHGAGSLGKTDCYRWVCSGNRNNKALLSAILPYLVIKKDKAIAALDWV